MWQRRQTLFLSLALLLALLSFQFPVARYGSPADPGQDYVLTTMGVFRSDGMRMEDMQVKYPLALLYGILAGVLLASIFFFRNRPRQIRIVRSTMVLPLLVAAFQFLTWRSAWSYLGGSAQLESLSGITMFLPLAILILQGLALRAIRKDEELVRSAERLR